MGLLYGLIAVGLSLIFGLMDVVNFAHGEFLMLAMYATFGLFMFLAIDPLLAAPLVAAGAPMDRVGFIGNVVGALKVEIVGHRRSIDKVSLIKGLNGLLK